MSLYTTGNWTVDEMITPASTTLITPSVATLSRSEYSLKKNADDAAVLVNSTGSGLTVAEELRFGAKSINNAYAGANSPASSQFLLKTGLQVLQEIRLNLKASNTVSGAEYELPFKAWVVFQTLQSDVVTSAAVEYVMRRLFGACIMGVPGHTFADRVLAIARGDYDPSDLV